MQKLCNTLSECNSVLDVLIRRFCSLSKVVAEYAGLELEFLKE